MTKANVDTGRTGAHNPVASDYNPADYHTPNFHGYEFFADAPKGHPLKELVRRIDRDPTYPYSKAMMACYGSKGAAAGARLRPDFAYYISPDNNNRYTGSALNVVDKEVDKLTTAIVRHEDIPNWEANLVYSDPQFPSFAPDARVQAHIGTIPPSLPMVDRFGGMMDAHVYNFEVVDHIVTESYGSYKHPIDGWVTASVWQYNARTGDWAPAAEPGSPHYVPPGKHRFPAVLVNAAALPMLPILLRYDEVYIAGEVKHPIGITLPNIKLSGTWTWPARGMAYMNRMNWGGSWGMTIPYGARLRLRSDWYRANVCALAGYDDEGFEIDGETVIGPDTPPGGWGKGALVILRAMRRYGLIVADGGNNFDMWAIQDSRWPWVGDLYPLTNVRCESFEVADFEDDLLEISVTPEVAPPDVERTVSITYHGWSRHPEEHPGYPDVIDSSPGAWGVFARPFQWTVALYDQLTHEKLGVLGPDTVDGGVGYARLTPESPTVTFKMTPGMENRRFFPLTYPYGLPWTYMDGIAKLPTPKPTTITISPSPAYIPPGGTLQFVAKVEGAGQNTVRWTSSFPNNGPWIQPVWSDAIDGNSGKFSDYGVAMQGTVTAYLAVDPTITTQVTVFITDKPPETSVEHLTQPRAYYKI